MPPLTALVTNSVLVILTASRIINKLKALPVLASFSIYCSSDQLVYPTLFQPRFNPRVLGGWLTGQVKLLRRLSLTPANSTMCQFQSLIWYTMHQRKWKSTRWLMNTEGLNLAMTDSQSCQCIQKTVLLKVTNLFAKKMKKLFSKN